MSQIKQKQKDVLQKEFEDSTIKEEEIKAKIEILKTLHAKEALKKSMEE